MGCYKPNIRIADYNNINPITGCSTTYKFINANGDQIKRYHDGTINYEWYEEQNKIIKENGFEYQLIPCGKCLGCKMQKQKEWAIRSVLEADNYKDNYFVTLTYDDNHKPWDDYFINQETGEVIEDDGTWNGYLDQRDMQLFFKRLRSTWKRRYKHEGIRYFYCGEYGANERPHYHAIIFNFPIDPRTLKIYKVDKASGKMLYTSDEIEKIWRNGFVVIEEFDYNAAAYVAGYVQKKQSSCRDYDYYAQKGQTPEYVRMSQGIGKDYLLKHMDIYDNDEIITKTGRMKIVRAKIPRYFDEIVKELENIDVEMLKSKRKESAQNQVKKQMEKTNLVRSEYLDQERRIAEDKGKAYAKRDKV